MKHKTPLEEVEAFLKKSGLSAASFGRAALGDPNFVSDLRNGRRLWPDTADRMRKFMREYNTSSASAA